MVATLLEEVLDQTRDIPIRERFDLRQGFRRLVFQASLTNRIEQDRDRRPGFSTEIAHASTACRRWSSVLVPAQDGDPTVDCLAVERGLFICREPDDTKW